MVRIPKRLQVLGLLAALAGAMALPACSGNAGTSEKPTVVATIFAYYDALRAVGGEHVNAVILLPAGTSPHDYDPTINDKRAATAAALIVKNGLGLDDWVDKLAADNKSVKVLTIGEKVQTLETEEMSLAASKPAATQADDHAGHDHAAHEGHDHAAHAAEKPATTQADDHAGHDHAAHEGHDHAAHAAEKPATAKADDHAGHDHAGHAHHHDGANPHIWLNPQVQIQATEAIRDQLIALYPAHKADFEKNAAAYIAQIKALDQQFAEAVKGFKNKKFIGLHSAYHYLADRYGLEQAAAIQDTGTSEPSPAKIREVIELVRAKEIKAVFAENALPSRSVELIAKETGAQRLVLQPLETYDDPKNSYVSLMQQNLEQLKKGLGQ